MISSSESLKFTGVVLLAVGMIFFMWTAHSYLQADHSKNWPSVSGRVVYSDASLAKAGGRRGVGDISAGLRYEYSVQNRLYSGNRLYFGQNMGDVYLLTQYSPGMEVRVFYDVQNPAVSVLKPGLRAINYWMFLSALAVSIFGIGMMKAGNFWIRRERAPT